MAQPNSSMQVLLTCRPATNSPGEKILKWRTAPTHPPTSPQTSAVLTTSLDVTGGAKLEAKWSHFIKEHMWDEDAIEDDPRAKGCNLGYSVPKDELRRVCRKLAKYKVDARARWMFLPMPWKARKFQKRGILKTEWDMVAVEAEQVPEVKEPAKT